MLYPDIVYCSGTNNINPAPAQSWKDPHTAIDRSIDDSKTALTLVAGSIGTLAMGANNKTGKVVGLGLALITQRTGSYILEQQRRALHEKIEINLELNRELSTPKALPGNLPEPPAPPIEKVAPLDEQGGCVNPSRASLNMAGKPEDTFTGDHPCPRPLPNTAEPFSSSSPNEPSSSIWDALHITDLINLPTDVSPELGIITGVYYLLIVSLISFMFLVLSLFIYSKKNHILKQYIKNQLLLRILNLLSIRSAIIYGILGFFNLIFAISSLQFLIDNWQ